jgi:hypothetical protein
LGLEFSILAPDWSRNGGVRLLGDAKRLYYLFDFKLSIMAHDWFWLSSSPPDRFQKRGVCMAPEWALSLGVWLLIGPLVFWL